MKSVLKYTLIADGSSDAILLNILKWLLDDLYPTLPNDGQFADFRGFKNPPKKLQDKIDQALEYYPCDLLFIHRDAETTDLDIIEVRKQEINTVVQNMTSLPPIVCIIPVKMMETWLLINSEAIKKAAANRNSKAAIALPPVKDLEKHQEPKKLLHTLLGDASGLKGRNLTKFNAHQAVHLVSEYVEDYADLRKLHAFQVLEADIKATMATLLS
jgi:hypothetical protein